MIQNSKRVGVILSGCGYLDGSEIHEAVLSLAALERAGLRADIFAPDSVQRVTLNHLTQQPEATPRHMRVEAARIARGQVQPLHAAQADQLAALLLPGGFGAARNLSNWAELQERAQVDETLAALIRAMHGAHKPLLAICIAPALLACVLGRQGITVTVGHDLGTAQAIEKTGAHHQSCAVTDCVADTHHRIITTPAYMCDASIGQVQQGIEQAVKQLAAWLA